jgi:hypothetical protein
VEQWSVEEFFDINQAILGASITSIDRTAHNNKGCTDIGLCSAG